MPRGGDCYHHSKYRELAIDKKDLARRWRTGMKYKIYNNGQVWEGESLKFTVDDEKILEYIFSRSWPSRSSFDKLLDAYPESFLNKMNSDSDRTEDLKQMLKNIADERKIIDEEMAPVLNYNEEQSKKTSLSAEFIFDKPLMERLQYMTELGPDTWIDAAMKNLANKTIAEALILLLNERDKRS